MSVKKTIVVTHCDVDGLICAVIAKAKYPDAEVIFTQPFALLKCLKGLGRCDLLIVSDLEVSKKISKKVREVLRKMKEYGTVIVFADHHPATERSLGDLSDLTFVLLYRKDRCAAQLLYEAMRPPANPPHLETLVNIAAIYERKMEPKKDEVAHFESVFLTKALQRDVWDDDFRKMLVDALLAGKLPSEIPQVISRAADSHQRFVGALEHAKKRVKKLCDGLFLVDVRDLKAPGVWGAVARKISCRYGGIAVLLCPSKKNDRYIVVARKPREINADLNKVVVPACSAVGGDAGGHEGAVGGKIPRDAVNAFVELLKFYYKKRMGGVVCAEDEVS